MYEYASWQREHLCFVLQSAEWGREDEPVIVAFKLGAVVVTFRMAVLLPQPFV
jgi:hypothetical protein